MRIILFVCLSLLVCLASARTITWTGAAGNSLWNFANNWDQNVVPTSADDVIINPLGGSTISVSAPAAANSITIGGGSYRQTLNLLSSLSVGAGGILVRSSGTLQVSSNNDLPLSSTGTVRVNSGASFVWASGDVTGPGTYIIDNGGGLVFSGPALKLIDKVTFNVYGQATIQPTTIQFARGGVLNLYGNTTAIGQITIFTTDTAANLFFVKGNFTYQGSSPTSPLNFQVNTTFQSDLNVLSGGITVSSTASFLANTILPIGTTLTTQAGLLPIYFSYIKGNGTLFVNSVVSAYSVVISVLNIAASGTLTTVSTSTVKSFILAGKLVVGGVFTTTDVSIQAGTVTGSGRLVATGNFEIAASTTGNVNNFISGHCQVAGRGYTTGSVTILFADLGNLHVLSSGQFTISQATTFAKQTGNPVVTNEGTFSINLPVGSVFTTSVDFLGANGVLNLNGGLVIFQGDTSVAGKVATTAVLIQFNTAVARWGPVTGTGSINVTAAPSAVSTFGQVQVSYFGVVNGNVNVTTLTASTLELFNGVLNVGTGTHSATIFNYYGGTLSGRATLTSSALTLSALTPATLNYIALSTQRFKLAPGVSPTSILVQNFATISAGN